MQLEVRVGDATLTALVNSGSTHNFVNEVARYQLGLTMQPTCIGMRVAMANGEKWIVETLLAISSSISKARPSSTVTRSH